MSTSKEDEPKGLTLDQKAIEILVANIIPTSKYFESRFDNLQYQGNEIKEDIKNLESRMEKRFEQVDKRFEQVDHRFVEMKADMDKRFEQVDQRFVEIKADMDKRFEKMDRRFQQVEDKLDKIIERIDRRIDEGLRENRAQSMRMFTFAMTFSAISMLGLIGKMLKLF